MIEFLSTTFTNDINGVNECVTEFQNILTNASKKSLKIKKKKTRRKITNIANKKWFDKECRIKRHELRKLANQKHKDPTNLGLRNAYQTALKIYKDTLQIKKNEFHKNKIDELIKATENDPKLFWKTLQNTSDNLENTTNSKSSPTEGQWLKHFEKLHCKHDLSESHEIFIKNLEENENDKDQYNQLDNEITDHEILNAAKKIKTKKAVY